MSKNLLMQTFGCQMNKLDSELISGSFIDAGYKLVDSESRADVILVNTCSVREHAEERVYSRMMNLKPLKAKKPGLVIGIIGCMAQKDKEGIFKRLPHVSLVCGPHRYKSIVKQVDKLRTKDTDKVVCADKEGLVKGESYEHSTFLADKDRAYVQVMRGCDNFCSYCIVPYVRGKEISRPPEDIIDEVGSLLDRGVKEITLLGQNVTAYGKSLSLDVIARSETPRLSLRAPTGRSNLIYSEQAPQSHGLPRSDASGVIPRNDNVNKYNLSCLLKELVIRHSSLDISFITSHPSDVTDELLTTMASLPQVKRELHMPAQSGSDRILKMMRRRYTRAEYLDIVRKAKELMPDIRIVSDFIVGFPTETDADFQDTVSLVKEARFYKVFIFKYSPRSGTKASKMADDVAMEIKKYRNNRLLEEFKKTK
ncbi:MAG: MiaB/RimO family radical SAM methylthiotransferase [Planctomycetes bacterium]|nr:MiaB/RimO family radical SAM methylthiotransferase [Planctomycetota bacterium]